MSQQFDTGFRPFTADAAIAQYARVLFEADGRIVEAGLTGKEVGIAQQEAFAAGDRITVKLRSAQGTHKMIAIEALAVGAQLYTETSGKVQDTAQATAFQVGIALEAAAADGDIIEVLYNTHGDTAAS